MSQTKTYIEMIARLEENLSKRKAQNRVELAMMEKQNRAKIEALRADTQHFEQIKTAQSEKALQKAKEDLLQTQKKTQKKMESLRKRFDEKAPRIVEEMYTLLFEGYADE